MKFFVASLLALGVQSQPLPAGSVTTVSTTRVISQPYPVVQPALPYVATPVVRNPLIAPAFPPAYVAPLGRPLAPALPLATTYPLVAATQLPLYSRPAINSFPITSAYVPTVQAAATPWITQNFNPSLFAASSTALPLTSYPALTTTNTIQAAGTIPPISIAEWEAMQAGRVPWPSANVPASFNLPYAPAVLPYSPIASWSSSSALPLASWQPAISNPVSTVYPLASAPISSWSGSFTPIAGSVLPSSATLPLASFSASTPQFFLSSTISGVPPTPFPASWSSMNGAPMNGGAMAGGSMVGGSMGAPINGGATGMIGGSMMGGSMAGSMGGSMNGAGMNAPPTPFPFSNGNNGQMQNNGQNTFSPAGDDYEYVDY